MNAFTCEGCGRGVHFTHVYKHHCDICDKRHTFCKDCFLKIPKEEYGPGKDGNPGYSQCPGPLFT